MKQYRILCSILLVSILCSICLLTGCRGQTSSNNEQFAELIALTKGQAPIFDEVAGGIDENDTQFVSEPHWSGAEQYRYQNESNNNLEILVGHRTGGKKRISHIIAESGEFFGVTLGKDTIDAVMEALGAPEMYEEKSDMHMAPMAVYHFNDPAATLWIDAREDRTVWKMHYYMSPFAELEALNIRKSGVLKEFEDGLTANADKVIRTDEQENGRPVYRLKDATRQNLKLFFDESDDLAEVSADEGNYFDIAIGKDTLTQIEEVLGRPNYYEKRTPEYGVIRADYSRAYGRLSLYADENDTIIYATYILGLPKYIE